MWIAFKICLLVVIVLTSGLLCAGVAAMQQISEGKLKLLSGESDRRAARILRMDVSGSLFLSVIRFAQIFIGMIFTGVLTISFTRGIVIRLYTGLQLNRFFGGWRITFLLVAMLLTLAAAFIFFIFGMRLPEKAGAQKAERTALPLSWLVALVFYTIRPLYTAINAVSSGILALFGLDPKTDENEVTEEEIRMLVEDAGESGAILESQREIIDNLFKFDDMSAGDVMNHRTEISAVDIDDGLSAVIKLAIDEGFSRIPVYQDDLDNIIGIIYVKDLLGYIGKKIPEKNGIKSIMRDAYHVPQSKGCLELFKEMTERRVQMAIVIDEYGGTAGIVTLEDLIEAILGNIQDEYDDEQEEIKRLNETTFKIEGVCDIVTVTEMLGVEFPQGDYDTIGGFILSQLGFIPEKGETPSVEYGGYRFTVTEIDERRIESVRAEKTPQPTN